MMAGMRGGGDQAHLAFDHLYHQPHNQCVCDEQKMDDQMYANLGEYLMASHQVL
jgi:hypothetical protein